MGSNMIVGSNSVILIIILNVNVLSTALKHCQVGLKGKTHSLVSAAEVRRWREHHPEIITVRHMLWHHCGSKAMFRSLPVASVATLPRVLLPRRRKSITGVPRLKDEIPLGLIKWGT